MILTPDIEGLTDAELEAELERVHALAPGTPHRDELIRNVRDILRARGLLTDRRPGDDLSEAERTGIEARLAGIAGSRESA